MQSFSSTIWTRIVVFNSYEDNHYTTGTSIPYWDHGFCTTQSLFTIRFLCIQGNYELFMSHWKWTSWLHQRTEVTITTNKIQTNTTRQSSNRKILVDLSSILITLKSATATTSPKIHKSTNYLLIILQQSLYDSMRDTTLEKIR